MQNQSAVLPTEIEQCFEIIFQNFLDYEKQWYKNDLVPFTQYAAQLKLKNHDTLSHTCDHLQQAHQLIKKYFALQELSEKQYPADESYAALEEAAKKWQQDHTQTNIAESNSNLEKAKDPNTQDTLQKTYRNYNQAMHAFQRKPMDRKNFLKAKEMIIQMNNLCKQIRDANNPVTALHRLSVEIVLP